MAFENRIVEHPGRVVLTPVSGLTNTYDADYTAEEGEVTQEGTLLDADSMNSAVQDIVNSSMDGITLTAGGTLQVRNIQSGSALITLTATNQTKSVNITFATPFENAPNVVATPNTGAPANCSVGVSNITTTGFTLTLTRTTRVNTSIHWVAIGM